MRASDAGKTVVLNGWVHRKRDHGGISFINLRDRYGITQIFIDGGQNPALAQIQAELRNEYCIAVTGTVRLRPGEMKNAGMPTGEIEVFAENLVILNRCGVLPFQIDDETQANDDLRLKYRYIDLRNSAMQEKIRLRSCVTFAVREWMTAQGFLEIETPTFIRSTPEGARDYLVPSRLYPGRFYALPQSPQLYKQLLMVSGFDKYFQIARCYRDEDSRGDRQPEFTQIDIEMSFVDRDDVLAMAEGLMSHVFKKCLSVSLPPAFTRISYRDSMERFGTDKPDLRFAMELQDFSAFVAASGFTAFQSALEAGGAVKALVVPQGAAFTRKQIDALEERAKIYKAKGMAWLKVSPAASSGGGKPPPSAALRCGLPPSPGGLTPPNPQNAPFFEGSASKFFGAQAAEICAALGALPGDLILLIADSKRKIANTALGAVRSKLGRDLNLCNPQDFSFVWIIDFPLFEFNEEENRWDAAHHMFSYPQEKFHDTLEAEPGEVLGDLYDLVLNGFELASGSIRIHDPVLQKRIFNIVGINEEEAAAKFGFLTEALSYGAPPHGGIAPGLDRLVMLMSGETSIKEVIAFPKNSFAQSPMDVSPGIVEQKQLDELHLLVKEPLTQSANN